MTDHETMQQAHAFMNSPSASLALKMFADLADNGPMDLNSADDLKTLTATTTMELIRALDRGDLTYKGEAGGYLLMLIGMALNEVLDGRMRNGIRTVESRGGH